MLLVGGSIRSIVLIFFGCGPIPLLVNWYPKYSTLFCMKKLFLKFALNPADYNCSTQKTKAPEKLVKWVETDHFYRISGQNRSICPYPWLKKFFEGKNIYATKIFIALVLGTCIMVRLTRSFSIGLKVKKTFMDSLGIRCFTRWTKIINNKWCPNRTRGSSSIIIRSNK